VTQRQVLVQLLQAHVAGDAREEADRCAMLRLAQELAEPLSRDEPSAHFTASAFVIEPGDASLEAAAIREAREETALDVELHPTAPRPFDVDIHEIPERPGEPVHLHLDVRYLLIGRGDPCAGAAWHPIGATGDGSVDRLAAKALAL
jgi:NUDIX domain